MKFLTSHSRLILATLSAFLLGYVWTLPTTLVSGTVGWIGWTGVIHFSTGKSRRSTVLSWYWCSLCARSTAFHWVPETVGAMICYDDINPENARQSTLAGANILTVQINASDFPSDVTLEQHLMLSRMRSVENRRYFVRCSATGMTCIISPWGEIVARNPAHTDGIICSPTHLMEYRTLFTQYGDLAFQFSRIGVLLVICRCILRWRAKDESR